MTKTPRQGASGNGKREARIAADPIASGLKELFGDIANEPVPDEFMQLLDRIDANDRAASREGSPPTTPNGRPQR